MFDKFLKLIQFYTKLNTEEIDFFKNHIPIRSFKKNEVFFDEGKISKTIYFILNGCVRLFYNVNGNEKTAFFYTEGKFICAGESYTFNIPAKENYQALEDTVLMCLDKRAIEKMFTFSANLEIIARIAVEDELITCQQMIKSFVTKSPEERYNELLEKNSNLFQRAPQQYIASFLGVSPETLSRIKKRVFEKRKKYVLDERQEF
jgi:CRP-like cAMP-binding protein